MAETYRIEKGELLLLKNQYSKKYLVYQIKRFTRRFISILIVIGGSGIITWMIYQRCVPSCIETEDVLTFSMLDCITTGSLFATFGSAIIGVFTLFTGKYLNSFYENLSILTEELAPDETGAVKWKRWAFIPRISRKRFAGKTQYTGIENASFVFQIGTFEKTFALPTTETDFKELPVLFNLLRMKKSRKTYLSLLEATQLMEEYPAWDCLTSIYRSILLYRISYFFVWVGVCFVLQSIIFAFMYPVFYKFAIQMAGLQSVIFNVLSSQYGQAGPSSIRYL